jgi:hypothetical protein
MLVRLKVLILEKYGSQSQFATCCGKGENWISRIVRERDAANPQDRAIICEKLEIENRDEYFGS